jgi:hypothetical protein
MKTLIFLFSIIGAIASQQIHAQMQMSDFDCQLISNSNVATSSSFRGSVKPNRTDSSGNSLAPSDSHFPVLVVFVQFKNEPNDPRNTWPLDSAPVYLENVIARDKNVAANWWDSYDPDTEVLSSHWLEVSHGVFHVIGPTPSNMSPALSVVLPHAASYYDSLGVPWGEQQINKDIWNSLWVQGLRDWRVFDRWSYNSADGYYYYNDLGQGDGKVDMIYKIHKSRGQGGLANFAGYNVLSYWSTPSPHLVDTANSISIDYSNGFQGSGVTVSFRGQLAQYIATAGHEHGHQLFVPSGHSTYSRVSYGFGYDNFSPADMILNGYMSPTTVTFNSTNNLGDYSSRSSGNGNLLKVPIQNNEYFLLASRNKYSKWDRVMFGDTAQIDMYGDVSEYGKGLYIYHVPNGLGFPNSDISQQDMECADGLFEWQYVGQAAQQVIHDCFVSGPTVWPYYNKKKVIYENDSSNLFLYQPPTGYTSRPVGDGISFRPYVGNGSFHVKWWGVGDQPANSCNIGTDRLFTNDEEIYTRFDIGGDREDAWKPGFNEVFSPYSSPNTNTWGNQSSGIFIWYNGYSGSGPGGVASLKIYKAGTGEPISLDSALHLTPPSRPMGLVVVPCDSQPTINGYKRIKLRWNHNMEPDMRRSIGGEGLAKRYRIYRSTASDMGSVPPDALAYSENFYDCIDTVDINENSPAEYIDDELVSICNTEACAPPNYCIEYPVRYRVQAVDKYDDVSVLSDFANTRAGSLEAGIGGDNLLTGNDSELPNTYSLSQNYPNPFNPFTNIRYDLPHDNYVTIKVYDVLGKEVVTLVNEYKEAGRYLVSFNAANYSSGIYFYTVNAGAFSQTRRMTVLK